MMQRVHEFAIHVELKLGVGSIADANGAGFTVAGKPGNLPFGQAPFARDPIHDLQLVWFSGRSAQ